MKNVEMIIHYLDGDMPVLEKEQFECEIQTNKTLAQQLKLTQEVDSLLADDELFTFAESLRTVNHKFINNEQKVHKKEQKPISIQFNRVFLSGKKLLVAAVFITFVLVLSVLYNTISSPNADRLFSKYYQKYEANILTRSSGATDVTPLIAAIQQYDKGNYSTAISKFEKIIQNDPNNTAAHFFIGVSYIEEHNYEKAIKNLSFVLTKNDEAFIEHAEWYLSLCYVKTKQTAKASALLTKIKERQTFYKLMAVDVLKKLNN